jgi:hypothetical protein
MNIARMKIARLACGRTRTSAEHSVMAAGCSSDPKLGAVGSFAHFLRPLAALRRPHSALEMGRFLAFIPRRRLKSSQGSIFRASG